MHVSYEHFTGRVVVNIGLYALHHPAGGPIGEGKTQHIGTIHTVVACQAHAFGEYLCFSTTRRSKHKVHTLLQIDYPLLTFVGLPRIYGIRHNRKKGDRRR